MEIRNKELENVCLFIIIGTYFSEGKEHKWHKINRNSEHKISHLLLWYPRCLVGVVSGSIQKKSALTAECARCP